MANISVQEAQGQFTKALVAVYKERRKQNGFLKFFFPDAPPSASYLVSLIVRRAQQEIAVDTWRGSDANKYEWSKSTEKLFQPLYYRLGFQLTSLQFYDRLWGSAKDGSISDLIYQQILESVADNIADLQALIEGAIELMCAQILATGVIEMSQGGTKMKVDYKRKNDSFGDPGNGNYWSDNKDLFAQIATGGKFLRGTGHMSGLVMNAILGSKAFTDMQNNTIFQKRQNFFHYQPDHVTNGVLDANGGVYFGWIECGQYKVNIFTYEDEYKHPDSGTLTPYVDPNTCILLPQKPNFITAYGAPPQQVDPGAAPRIGQFVYGDWISPDKRTHNFEVESCPLPIPVAVDQIYTLKTGTGS